MVVNTFNPRTREAEAGEYLFKASLVYVMSSRTARTTQRTPVSQSKQAKKQTKNLIFVRCGGAYLSASHREAEGADL